MCGCTEDRESWLYGTVSVHSSTVVERGSDRRVRRRYVFRDRRSGFDRREENTTRWSAALARLGRGHTLEVALVLLLALNAGDLVFTVFALDAGAVEANPIMAALFSHSVLLAAAVKALAAMVLVFTVLAFRRYRKMMALTVFGLTVYSALFVYHLVTTPVF